MVLILKEDRLSIYNAIGRTCGACYGLGTVSSSSLPSISSPSSSSSSPSRPYVSYNTSAYWRTYYMSADEIAPSQVCEQCKGNGYHWYPFIVSKLGEPRGVYGEIR